MCVGQMIRDRQGRRQPPSPLAALLSVAVVVLAVFVSLPAARAAAPSASSVDLRIGFLQAVDSLNPFLGINDQSYEFWGLIYDHLFSFDQDGNYVPNIALSASCDATCANWTYAIRPGVLWSDGTPLTADDVAFSINYNLPSGNSFYHLWAYEPYVNRILACKSGQKTGCGAIVTSRGNVTVYYDRPFAPGKDLMVWIIQKAQWSGVSQQQAQTSYSNSNPIGTGPFIADPNIGTEWTQQPTVPIHVFKNPNYHPVGNHTGPPHLDNIYLQQYTDENSLAIALQIGDIDLADLTPAGYELMAGQPNIVRQQALTSIQYWNEIAIQQLDSSAANGRLNPARWDLNVRHAMAFATNKDYILQTIYGGKGVRGDSLISPLDGAWWYDPTKDPGANLSFSLTAANALLDGAGYSAWWTDSAGARYRMASTNITLSIQTGACGCLDPTNTTKTVPFGTHLEFSMGVRLEFPEEQRVGNYLASQWAQVGIKLDVQVLAETTLASDVYNGYLDTYIWYWAGDPDPNYLLSIQSGFTLDGWDDNYWNNATYNAMYIEQLATLDVAQRQALVQQMEKLHYESAAYLIYIYPYGQWAWRTDTLAGWGDWAAHPYRQLDSYWGANPLFLELEAAGASANQPPSTPVIQGGSSLATVAGQNVTFVGNSVDPDPNQTLSWTWTWGDGSTTTHSHPSSVERDVTNHSWAGAGQYTVTLNVSDGLVEVGSAPVTVLVTPAGSEGTVRGWVLDALSGDPIVGATLRTSPGGYGGATDGSGAFAFATPAGTYTLTVRDPLYLTASQAGLVVTTGAVTWANFTLTPDYGWIAGSVTSSAGDPVPGALVNILSAANASEEYAVRADAGGHYNTTHGLPAGSYNLTVGATGYSSVNRTADVRAGETTTVDVVLLSSSTAASGLSPLVIAGAGAAVVIGVGAGMLVLLRHRKKGRTDEEQKLQLRK